MGPGFCSGSRRWGAVLWIAMVAAGCSGPKSITPPPAEVDAGPDAGPMMPDAAPTFPDSGIGTTGLVVARVVPDHGPFTGGTTAVVRGSGFTADALVTIGGHMVQPADTRLIDSRRLSIVVPAGAPGPADVTVKVGDSDVTLPGGYTYEQIMVDPSRGSVSGGTVITISGSGTHFVDGDTVLLGRAPCNDVTVVSETRITCRTPPMAAGTVDVTVVAALDGSTTVAQGAYTYYDTSDPFGGGLGGGPLAGNLNVTAFDAMTGNPIPDAFVIVGDEMSTPYQGKTDIMGQISFSGSDLTGKQTVTVAKHCYEKTSIVSFDATDVTVFLVPWMDPMCGMGSGMPPAGRGRNGAFINGELAWLGPNEYGPNPWDNIPPPRPHEVKVAYVFTTQRCPGDSTSCTNPDPSLGGSVNRVLETPIGDMGYPYRIFARPAGLAVYALAGLENTQTQSFIPYVMGIARNVLAGPGEEVSNINITMDIPLDHTLPVRLADLPDRARTGPDRFKVTADIDLGGEGVIVPNVDGTPLDVVRGTSIENPFRLWAQPALYGDLSDGRYRVEAGWYTGDFDANPYTMVVQTGVRDVSSEVLMNNFLGIPQATAPAYGAALPADRVLRWSVGGPDPDMFMIVMQGGDGNPAWRHIVRGDVHEAPIPDLSSIPGVDDISSGFVYWSIYALRIPGFRFDEFSYTYLQDQYWSASAVDQFTAQR